MKIIDVNLENIKLFSMVLNDAAECLIKSGQSMWKLEKLTIEELLKEYDINDMKMCYENNNLIGVFILQWYDQLFWPEIEAYTSGFIHKLAIKVEFRGKGYGNKIIEEAKQICINQNVKFLRLNCGTFRTRLRNFYENAGFIMIDRVFVDNRDQIRYEKFLG